MIEEVWQIHSDAVELGQVNVCDGVIIGGCSLAQHYAGTPIDAWLGWLARNGVPIHVTSRIVYTTEPTPGGRP